MRNALLMLTFLIPLVAIITINAEEQVQDSRISIRENLFGDEETKIAVAKKLDIQSKEVIYNPEDNLYRTSKGTYHVVFKRGEVNQVIEIFQ